MSRSKYTIGQMADLCNISAKQLRHYDQLGILTPQFKDSVTGYRYYSDNQIEEILLIKELRTLNLPLDTIRGLLENRNLSTLKKTLEAQLAVLRSEIIQRQRQYDSIVSLLLRMMESPSQLEPSQGYQIQRITMPARHVCFTRYVSNWNAKHLFLNRRAELQKLCQSMKLSTTGPNMAIFHNGYMHQFSTDPMHTTGDLEVCYEIDVPAAVMFDRVSEPCIRTIPSFEAVSCTYMGHYRDMKPAYEAMEQWAASRDIPLSNISLEEYIIGATNTKNEKEYITRLYIPLKSYTL